MAVETAIAMPDDEDGMTLSVMSAVLEPRYVFTKATDEEDRVAPSMSWWPAKPGDVGFVSGKCRDSMTGA